MRVLETRVMRGPNIWSNYRQHLIVMTLDLEELETRPTHRISGFSARIRKMLPSLQSHRCSEGHKGGFFQRVEQGTWMGHVIEHIALEMQSLAGMECGYGRTRSTDTAGVYHVVFAYRIEEAGRYAGRAAIRVASALIEGHDYDINRDIDELRRIAAVNKPGPSTASIIEEARLAHIPFKRFRNSLLILGYGNRQKKIRATVAGTTAGIGMEIAKDKQETKILLERSFIPTPYGTLVYEEQEVTECLSFMKFPLVIKPVDGNHGRGITTSIRSKEALTEAFRTASAVSVPVMVEEYVEGSDYRVMLVNYKVVAVAKRNPAGVTGNGTSTIAQLIEKVNADPRRGEGHENILTRIKVTAATEALLHIQGLSLDSVLSAGKTLPLSHTANLSTGGTSEDVTDEVHPYNISLAERIARIVNLDICGIDIIAKDLREPLDRRNGAVLEVNAGPGLRMHLYPEKGFARNVARPIIQMLFPGNSEGRIPVIAITGSSGKTTVAQMITHFAEAAGKKVGAATSEGIRICGQFVCEGDCTEAENAETVLFDPEIDFAVLECSGQSIMRSGLAFDVSDISIVTNIDGQFNDLEGINTVEDLVRVKTAVPRTTRRKGYAILNADDPLVMRMRTEIDCRIALYSTDALNTDVAELCGQGGVGAVLDEGFITIRDGRWKFRIEDTGLLKHVMSHADSAAVGHLLPSVLAAYLQGFDHELIKNAISTFFTSRHVEVSLAGLQQSARYLKKAG